MRKSVRRRCARVNMMRLTGLPSHDPMCRYFPTSQSSLLPWSSFRLHRYETEAWLPVGAGLPRDKNDRTERSYRGVNPLLQLPPFSTALLPLMPELAEVEFYRKRWHQAAVGDRVIGVLTHDTKKLLRELELPAFRRALTGAKFESSASAAKQMLFRFSGNAWLGIHLGMSGELSVAARDHAPRKHDHLVLMTKRHAIVF